MKKTVEESKMKPSNLICGGPRLGLAVRLGLAGLLVAAGLAGVASPLTAQERAYPEARKGEVVDDYHGTAVADPYRWLEDTDSEETNDWVEAENAITFAYLEAIPQRERIRRRLTELWDYERYGVPFQEADRYFYFKNDGLQNQSVLYVQDGLAGESRVLLDPNTLSEDGTVALTTVSVTEDGEYLGYGTAAGGSDWREFHVRRVSDGHELADRIRWVKFSGLSWTRDGEGFFYSRYPAASTADSLLGQNQDQKVYYHRVGTAQDEDALIYERPDQPEWGFGVRVTEDGRYAVMNVSHGTHERNRVYYQDLGESGKPRLGGEVVRLLDDFDASYNFVGSDGSTLFFVTNLEAPRQRLIGIDIERPARANWREVVAEQDDVLQSARIIAGRLVIRYLHDAHSRVRIHRMDGTLETELELPALGTVSGISGKADGTKMFYAFTSYLYPTTVFRHDFETGETGVFRAPEVDFDPSRYVTTQVFYTSKDGTRVPMFITHRRGVERTGANPTLLYAYGGFNISITPRFSISNLVWLEMGGIYAVANLRGGGEYGEEWHAAGMKGSKQNVFDDFVSAAEYLIDEGYTSREKLAIAGGSNGGLLVGAAITQRPDLFGAALPAVGVMDMLRFQKFTIGWAWVSDYGTSDEPEGFEYLYAYSPYHNLEPGTCYPPTLVTTADHDDRVVPGHSFKFAARLQEVQACDRPVLIRIETKAGHGAGKPTSKRIAEAADRWAFLVKTLDIGM
ncbi:MAG: prolyl oligopeptidase family serine peptidase [Gemmatimonadota bacterium]